jgi:hypothetical protein
MPRMTFAFQYLRSFTQAARSFVTGCASEARATSQTILPVLRAAWPALAGAAIGGIWLWAACKLILPEVRIFETNGFGSRQELTLPVRFNGVRLDLHYDIHLYAHTGSVTNWNIVPDDDLRSLSINGKAMSLAAYPPEKLHDWENGIHVDFGDAIRAGDNVLEVGLSNHSGPGGLDLRPVLSAWHWALLGASALPLLLGLGLSSRRLSPWIAPRRLALLTLIVTGCAVRIWLIYRTNPVDNIWSDPQRHWEQGIDVLRLDPMSMIDPILYQLYIGALGKLTLKLPLLVAFYTSVLSILCPWLWYRFLRELLPANAKNLALGGWAILVWLPSWSAIYSYFMQETLMLPLLGAALWATWRCRRKGDTASFVVATLAWTLAGLTRGICIPLAAVAMLWLWMTQTHKLRRTGYTLLLLIGILGPLTLRSEYALNMAAPNGVSAMVQLYQRSGAREVLFDFDRQGSHWGYGFTSPGILQEPFYPLSHWRSSRQGSARFYVNLDRGAAGWADAMATLQWDWPRVLALGGENLIFLFFSESWPDTNPALLVGQANSGLRWIWVPLSLVCLVVGFRQRKQQRERLLPTLILTWFVVQGVFPLSVNEGRYRKPFEGLLVAQCLLLAASRRRHGSQSIPATNTQDLVAKG